MAGFAFRTPLDPLARNEVPKLGFPHAPPPTMPSSRAANQAGNLLSQRLNRFHCSPEWPRNALGATPHPTYSVPYRTLKRARNARLQALRCPKDERLKVRAARCFLRLVVVAGFDQLDGGNPLPVLANHGGLVSGEGFRKLPASRPPGSSAALGGGPPPTRPGFARPAQRTGE